MSSPVAHLTPNGRTVEHKCKGPSNATVTVRNERGAVKVAQASLFVPPGTEACVHCVTAPAEDLWMVAVVEPMGERVGHYHWPLCRECPRRMELQPFKYVTLQLVSRLVGAGEWGRLS